MTIGDGIGLTITALAYIVAVITTARSIRREGDLSDRELLWATALVIALPVIGILLWVVVGPDRAWRIFSRRLREQAEVASRQRVP